MNSYSNSGSQWNIGPTYIPQMNGNIGIAAQSNFGATHNPQLNVNNKIGSQSNVGATYNPQITTKMTEPKFHPEKDGNTGIDSVDFNQYGHFGATVFGLHEKLADQFKIQAKMLKERRIAFDFVLDCEHRIARLKDDVAQMENRVAKLREKLAQVKQKNSEKSGKMSTKDSVMKKMAAKSKNKAKRRMKPFMTSAKKRFFKFDQA